MMLTLSPEELVDLTKRGRPKAQARMLQRLGVPFATHPDGSLLVSRASAEAVLSGRVANDDEIPPTVNLDAIRSWGNGKAAHASRSK